MGRKAGVSAEETRTELLAAAARVFAAKGYDGASIADICNEAGLSTGPVYAHYGSKAELFVAVLKAHGHRQYEAVVGSTEGDVADFLAVVGSRTNKRPPAMAALVIEAMVASGRDPEVAELVGSWLTTGEAHLAASIRDAQAAGTIVEDISPEAISRLATMIGLGSFLTTALNVPRPDHDEWSQLIQRVIDAFRT